MMNMNQVKDGIPKYNPSRGYEKILDFDNTKYNDVQTNVKSNG